MTNLLIKLGLIARPTLTQRVLGTALGIVTSPIGGLVVSIVADKVAREVGKKIANKIVDRI